IIAVRIFVVCADVVGRNRTMVVRVGFRVWNRVPLALGWVVLSALGIAKQKLVVAFVVAFGLLDSRLIAFRGRHAEAIAIGLNPVVPLALAARPIRINNRQQPALRISSLY